jgi:AraC-like DNA-binding protein
MASIQLTASAHIRPFAAFLANHGEQVQPLLRRAGLPVTCMDDPGKLVPTAAIWRFRELTAIRTGLPNLTLNVVEPLELPELGAIGQAVARAPTLLQMIQDFMRLARRESSTAILSLRPQPKGDFFFSNRFALVHPEGEWHAELYLLIWMLKIVRLVDPTWCPEEISCAGAATPDRRRAIERLAGRALFDRPCTGFPIPPHMLALPRSGGDRIGGRPDADAACDAWIADSTAGSIRQLIRAYADDRWPTFEEVGDLLGASKRTIQRQLAAEGTTYSRTLEETRAEAARDLLEGTDASLSEIARRLGYTNLSNFNRAFRSWAALSPRAFRAQRPATPAPRGRSRDRIPRLST